MAAVKLLLARLVFHFFFEGSRIVGLLLLLGNGLVAVIWVEKNRGKKSLDAVEVADRPPRAHLLLLLLLPFEIDFSACSTYVRRRVDLLY